MADITDGLSVDFGVLRGPNGLPFAIAPTTLNTLEHPRERTMADYIEMRQRQERKPFEPHFDEAVRLVKARRFRTMSDLASHFGKAPRWATLLSRIVVKQRCMSVAEWKASFIRGTKHGRPIEMTEPAQEAPIEAVALVDEYSGLTSIDGYMESVGAILERMKAKEFCSEAAMARFYKRPLRTIEALRGKVVNGGLMTADGWFSLFVVYPKKRAVIPSTSWNAVVLESLRPLLRSWNAPMPEEKDSVCAITNTQSS